MRASQPRGPVARPAPFRHPIGLGPRLIAHTDPASAKTSRAAKAPKGRARSSPMALYGAILGFLVAGAAAVGIGATFDSPRSLMTRQDYAQARSSLETQTRAALAHCRELESRERLLCRATARGDDRIRKAQLEARYRGTVEAAADVRLAKARAAFEIARVQCNDRSAEEKSSCLDDARAERSRALAAAIAAST